MILRPGMIGIDAIAAVIGRRPRLREAAEHAPRVSGALAAHYAPRTPMRMAGKSELDTAASDCAILSHSMERPARLHAMSIVAPSDAQGFAHDLYANLRALDASGAREILVEALPADPAWEAVRDRLGRAIVGSGIEDDET